MFAVLTAIAFAWRLLVVLSVGEGSVVGVDRGIYKEAALRWAGGGFWYYPEQLAGPYTIIQGHVLYPPTALAWLVPAAYLPDALWWGLPICAIAGIVWHHRPTIWAWPVMGLCLSTFWSVEIIASGNPGLWIAMFAALGTVWRPAFALVLLKPSLGPFALLGAPAVADGGCSWPPSSWCPWPCCLCGLTTSTSFSMAAGPWRSSGIRSAMCRSCPFLWLPGRHAPGPTVSMPAGSEPTSRDRSSRP